MTCPGTVSRCTLVYTYDKVGASVLGALPCGMLVAELALIVTPILW
jgi:hypothetical protein